MLNNRFRHGMSQLYARLRSRPLQTLAFALLGAVVATLAEVPEWLIDIEQDGLEVWLARMSRDIFGTAVAALVVMLAMRVSTDKGADMVRRPLKFLTFLMIGTVSASFLAWLAITSVKGARFDSVFDVPLIDFAEAWIQAVIWGGLFGWLYLLTLQHAEDQQHLAVLLSRRSMLARQLAKARLGTARAQIDPAMVAKVLTVVHARYRDDPPAAGTLLDHLISYLRLAMNRVRVDRPTLATEMTLIRAFIALREAEHGVSVTFAMHHQDQFNEHAGARTGGPLFLLARALVDDAIHAGAASMQLSIDCAGGQVSLRLAMSNNANGPACHAAMTQSLAALNSPDPALIHMTEEPGVLTYVVNDVFR
jgi:hypothetical protein